MRRHDDQRADRCGNRIHPRAAEPETEHQPHEIEHERATNADDDRLQNPVVGKARFFRQITDNPRDHDSTENRRENG